VGLGRHAKSAKPGIEKLIKNGHIYEAHAFPGTAEFLGDENGASREEAARNYRGLLQEGRNQVSQGTAGPHDRVQQPHAWWEPFAQEAEGHWRFLRRSTLDLAGNHLRAQGAKVLICMSAYLWNRRRFLLPLLCRNFGLRYLKA
jgi:hypothetical protein